MIGAHNLSGAHVVVVASYHGAILMHLVPEHLHDAGDGDRYFRDMMAQLDRLYRNFLHFDERQSPGFNAYAVLARVPAHDGSGFVAESSRGHERTEQISRHVNELTGLHVDRIGFETKTTYYLLDLPFKHRALKGTVYLIGDGSSINPRRPKLMVQGQDMTSDVHDPARPRTPTQALQSMHLFGAGSSGAHGQGTGIQEAPESMGQAHHHHAHMPTFGGFGTGAFDGSSGQAFEPAGQHNHPHFPGMGDVGAHLHNPFSFTAPSDEQHYGLIAPLIGK